METGESSISPGRGRPRSRPRPPRVTTGTVEITVKLEAICWDTFASEGSTDSSDRPLAEALVALSPASGEMMTQMTPDDGVAKVRFENVPVGAARARLAREGFRNADTNVTVTAGGTASATVVMRREGLGCTRKHPTKPPPSGEIGETWLGPMFWTSEPWILVLRDVLWLLLLVTSAILIPIGIGVPQHYVCLCIGAFLFAIWSYVNHIVTGMIFGVIGMVLAFGGFLAIVVFEILAMLTTPPLPVANSVTGAFGMPPPDIYMFPHLCAIWVGFAAALIAGRREFFNYYQWATVIVVAIIGAVVATVIYLVMDFVTHGMHFSDWAWMAFVQFVCGFIAAFIGGFLGHVFINDGKVDEGTAFEITDLELPYAGERYCVQGHHGYISHWLRRRDNGTVRNDQEYSYDWSLPEGTPILAAKEGHIIAYKEDRTGNSMSGNDQENFIEVKHRDGSVAEYLHLRRGGVLEINPFLGDAANRTRVSSGTFDDGTSRGEQFTLNDPVFVHAGQRIAAVGNVGVSMFDHIHFHVVAARPNGDRRYAPIKFKDPDVATHEGRCYSMRKYRSGNIDRGPASLT